MLVLWFAVFGFVTAYVLLIAHGRALFPLHLVGRGLTPALNMASMGGTFLVQAVGGFVYGFRQRPCACAYRLVFARSRLYPIGLSRLFRLGRTHPGAPGTQGSGASAKDGTRPCTERVNIPYTSPCYLCAAMYVAAVR